MNFMFISVVVALTRLFGLALAPFLASSPANEVEESQVNRNPNSVVGDHLLLLLKRPSTPVLPPGVSLASRGKTHMTTALPVSL